MVKGTSRQVIVVQAPDPKLFEQAIFILREDARDVTDEALLKEAAQAVRNPTDRRPWYSFGPLWALAGAAATAVAWLLTAVL